MHIFIKWMNKDSQCWISYVYSVLRYTIYMHIFTTNDVQHFTPDNEEEEHEIEDENHLTLLSMSRYDTNI